MIRMPDGRWVDEIVILKEENVQLRAQLSTLQAEKAALQLENRHQWAENAKLTQECKQLSAWVGEAVDKISILCCDLSSDTGLTMWGTEKRLEEIQRILEGLPKKKQSI
jgi:hypothetical protein